MDGPSSLSSPALKRALAGLIGLCLVLCTSTGYLLIERRAQAPDALLEVAKASKEVQAEAIAALVEGADGVWDSHPDADVARIMQPDVVEREFRGVPVSSNGFGLREAPFEARKPAGVTRIVLLGDSFVFGFKAKAEDRLGVFLKRYLIEQGAEGEIECLHLAASSWNILSETSYLRRQLNELRPDLVVQVIISNDLDDTRGPRGFGAMGNYSPQVRSRAGGLVSNLTPQGLWSRRVQGYLLYNLDHESRARYAAAAGEIQRLAAAVEAQGGKYLLLSAWETYSPMVLGHLALGLRPEQSGYVSLAFSNDRNYRVDEEDRHWNRAGHEKIAQLLYGLISTRKLLPSLHTPPWPEAETALQQIEKVGAQEASHGEQYEALLLAKASDQISSSIDFDKLTRLGAKQVHAGIGAGGLVSPYASLILANPRASKLLLDCTHFPGPGLAGGQASVAIEGVPVGSFELGDSRSSLGLPWLYEYAIPAELQSRPFLTVSIESDDYIYSDLASGECSAFRLNRIALE